MVDSTSFFKKLFPLVARRFSLLLITLALLGMAQTSFAGTVHRVATKSPRMAFTFDDGGSPVKVRATMDILERYGARGTFFPVGSFIRQNPILMREIVRRGHEVGNHSDTHPDLKRASAKALDAQIKRPAASFKKITGQPMAPFFRPPYGSYNQRVAQSAKKAGFPHIAMWSIDTNDWRGRSSKSITSQVLKEAAPGKIVLMHTTQHVHSTQALPALLESLQKRGYHLVTLGQLTGLRP